jgi:hypothetical protein
LKQNAKKANGTFIEIPPGDSRKHGPQENNNNYPKLRYKQKEDENTCLMISVAYLLHECGACEHASFLVNDRLKITKSTKYWTKFQEKLCSFSTKLKLQETKLQLDNVLQGKVTNPIITCVRGSDFKENHSVVIYNNWIYDGNFKTALPLTKESLDECCSTDKKKCSFVAFVKTYILQHFDAYLKKNCACTPVKVDTKIEH